MTPTHVVLRPFKATSPVELKVGQPVDASAWPNTGLLESQGYLRPMRPGELAKGEGAPASRRSPARSSRRAAAAAGR